MNSSDESNLEAATRTEEFAPTGGLSQTPYLAAYHKLLS
jgi:hypothetical protein